MTGIVLCDASAEIILEREVLGKGHGLEPTNRQSLPDIISLTGMSDREWSIQIDSLLFSHLHLLVGKHRDFRHCCNITFHQWLGTVPPGAILRIDEPFMNNVFVTSGSFMALLASRTHTLTALAQHIMYLCGYYCMHQKEPLLKRGPLASKEEIERMMRFTKSTVGWKRLSRILPYCAEGVRSPQEANFYIVATFPRVLGGYEFPKPQVNVEIPVEGMHATLAGAPSIEVDFYWEDEGVVVEYNGLDNHEGGISPLDITQQIILKEKGIDVVFLTKEQLFNPALLDLMMLQLANKIGIRPIDGWPSMKSLKMLLRSLRADGGNDRRFTSKELLDVQKRWIRCKE